MIVLSIILCTEYRDYENIKLKAIFVSTLMPIRFLIKPLVIKADGLAAGKGVFICETEKSFNEALLASISLLITCGVEIITSELSQRGSRSEGEIAPVNRLTSAFRKLLKSSIWLNLSLVFLLKDKLWTYKDFDLVLPK